MKTPGPNAQGTFFNPLKSAFLWAFGGTHLLVAFAIGNLRFIAPDEGTYLKIFRGVYTPGYSTADVFGFHGTQEWFLRIAYFPAHLLSSMGVEDVLAIRIHSVVLSTISVYLVMVVLKFNMTKTRFLLLFGVCSIPSVFFWMTLGLRETFIFLSFSLICTGLYFLMFGRDRLGFSLLLLGNIVLFETKPVLFLIAIGAQGLSLIYNFMKQKKMDRVQFIIVLGILIPLLIFPRGVLLPFNLPQDSRGEPSGFVSTSEVLSREIKANPNNLLVKLLVSTGLDSKLASSADSSGKSKPVLTRTSRLDVQPSGFKDVRKIAARSLGFLLTPFPLINNGSTYANILSYELPIWLLLYGAFFVALWRRFKSKAFDELLVFIVSFSTVFLIFSAATEVNVGTALRHRSVIIIPALFLIFSSSRKSESAD